MRRLTRHAHHIAAAAVAAGMLLTAALSAQAQDRQYIMATATTGGTYYPVGVAIATLSKLKLEPQYGFSLSAISSAGSGENVKLMREDEAQFAILQGLYGAWAATGTGQLENTGPQENLRAVTMLWRNVEHFVLHTDEMKTRTIHDLKGLGKPFSMGKRNSGSEGSALHILSALGIEPGTDFDVISLGYGPSADAIQDGKAVGMNTPAGVPVSAVTRAFAAANGDLVVLAFSLEDTAIINAALGDDIALWSPFTIPAGTYPGQQQDVATIAQPNFLAVNADVSDEDVYQLTKAVYENLPFLAGIHVATKDMALDSAITGLPLPLHPGALRYYEEAGLEVPQRLKP
ncbi:TAXI family TRAP transporter solute-binding subunit [Pyruvatibacter mobilis]|uniref:TAXI family TRAP transporter solute-binding subunit n=1 Tax=Pyruvatibacter mobilis TaxID=1712261 RepID=UPI003D096B1B